jgi:hypothetical protein
VVGFEVGAGGQLIANNELRTGGREWFPIALGKDTIVIFLYVLRGSVLRLGISHRYIVGIITVTR